MVKIAVAGGSGELGREVVDALVARGNHTITVLTRRAAPRDDGSVGVTFRAVDYNDHADLVEALRGTHTVLSFVQPAADPGCSAQKNLIDACVAAGVKRFAPSEYGSAETGDLPFWAGKSVIRKYLEEVNGSGKVLEYTLFQPGLFLDYLAYPFKTASYVTPLSTFFDFQNRRAIVVEGHEEAVMTLTTVRDIAGIVARAVEYEGGWPKVGGIRGNRVTVSRILEIGRQLRGNSFSVERVALGDLEAGRLNTSWLLSAQHPTSHGGDPTEIAAVLKTVLVSTLLSSAKGAWDVSEAWNVLLPDYHFADIEGFLSTVWEGKA